MEIDVITIGEDKKEYIRIGCHRVDSNIKEIVRFIESRQGRIDGKDGDSQVSIPLADIFYAESVDNKTFIYLQEACYESGLRLYELEEALSGNRFVRISKSVIVNLMKVESIRPALNGRYMCRLMNGEDVIISRKYVTEVKEKISR